MRRPATITVLVFGIAISLYSASVSDGKIVARWHSRSYDAKFTAKGCGSSFEAIRTFSSAVKQLKLRQPAVGVSVLDPEGSRVAKVSSIEVSRHSNGSREVVWRATPGLECPPQLPPEPIGRSCNSYKDIADWEACEMQNEEATRRWTEERTADRQAKNEYRAIWGKNGTRNVQAAPTHFAYRFFTRKKVSKHPPPAPCDYLLCEASRALSRILKANYGLTTTSANCHQLSAERVHCYFQGLTPEDRSEGNIAGHKGDAYVTRFPGGFDVQVQSFSPA